MINGDETDFDYPPLVIGQAEYSQGYPRASDDESSPAVAITACFAVIVVFAIVLGAAL